MRKIIHDHENNFWLCFQLIHITNFSLQFFSLSSVNFHQGSKQSSQRKRLFAENISVVKATHFCSLSTTHVAGFCCRKVKGCSFSRTFQECAEGSTSQKTLLCLTHTSIQLSLLQKFHCNGNVLSILQGLVLFSIWWSTGS